MNYDLTFNTFYIPLKVDKNFSRSLKEARESAGFTQEGFGKDAIAMPVDEPAGTIAAGLPTAVAAVELQPDAETGEIMMELLEHGEQKLLAKGGDGGFGNLHYKTSTNRAPRKKTPGWPGEQRSVRLELRVLADVGLLGMPNAGKSTFIAAVSNARPKIADYAFTTLTPNLGVVSMPNFESFVVAGARLPLSARLLAPSVPLPPALSPRR